MTFDAEPDGATAGPGEAGAFPERPAHTLAPPSPRFSSPAPPAPPAPPPHAAPRRTGGLPPPPPPPRIAEPPPPPVSPYANLPTHHRTVIGGSFDLLTHSAADIRSASLYAGLIVLLTTAPLAILLWRLIVLLTEGGIDLTTFDPETFDGPFLPADEANAVEAAAGPLVFAAIVAFAGIFVAGIDSRAMMASLLGARLAGERLSRRDALRRARATFWRIVGGTMLLAVPTGIAQNLVAELYRGRSSPGLDFAGVAAGLSVAVIAAPFTYILAGIVLGEVGPLVSARRSITLFRVRVGAAIIVALFALAGQFIVLAGLAAGADLVVRGFDALGLGSLDAGLGGVVAVTVILVFAFAIGSLLATVAALEIAPQILMFAALTHVAPGLRTLEQPADPPRLLTAPMIVLVGIGFLCLLSGLAAFSGV